MIHLYLMCALLVWHYFIPLSLAVVPLFKQLEARAAVLNISNASEIETLIDDWKVALATRNTPAKAWHRLLSGRQLGGCACRDSPLCCIVDGTGDSFVSKTRCAFLRLDCAS